MHFQRTFLGKGEAKGTPLEPRQGRSPAPPFPNRSLDFALGRNALLGVIEAAEAHLIVPVLVGPAERIRAAAAAVNVDISGYQLVATEHSQAAAEW